MRPATMQHRSATASQRARPGMPKATHRDLLVTEVSDRLRLESDIISERWSRLQEAVIRVQNHKDAFRQECATLARETEALEAARTAFEADVSARWPAANLDDEAKQVRFRINVGGRRFETTAEVLTRDRFSVLAALCTDRPPVDVDAEDHFFFDRDGELFQHTLNFLREGVLPDDDDLLRGLYSEAAFFRLGLLRRHVEARMNDRLTRSVRTGRGAAAPTPDQLAAAGLRTGPPLAGTGMPMGTMGATQTGFPSGLAASTVGAATVPPTASTASLRPAARRPEYAAAPLPDPYGFTSKRWSSSLY